MSLESDYAIVREALRDIEADEGWDMSDYRHALARIWHVLRKQGLVTNERLAEAEVEIRKAGY